MRHGPRHRDEAVDAPEADGNLEELCDRHHMLREKEGPRTEAHHASSAAGLRHVDVVVRVRLQTCVVHLLIRHPIPCHNFEISQTKTKKGGKRGKNKQENMSFTTWQSRVRRRGTGVFKTMDTYPRHVTVVQRTARLQHGSTYDFARGERLQLQ